MVNYLCNTLTELFFLVSLWLARKPIYTLLIQINAPSSCWGQSSKKLYLFQIFHCILCEVLYLKKLKSRRKYLCSKYAALNIIRTNATKEKRTIFSVAIPDRQLFVIYTKKLCKCKNHLQKQYIYKSKSSYYSGTQPIQKITSISTQKSC